jgi:hypothetical protein
MYKDVEGILRQLIKILKKYVKSKSQQDGLNTYKICFFVVASTSQ